MRQAIDDGTARIAEAEQLADFVVGLARCVVARRTELGDAAGRERIDSIQRGVAARDEQRQERQLGRFAGLARVLQIGGAQVAD